MPFSLIILIAVVQGLTEFLPISSSGHLVLIPIVTNFAYQGRLIDVAAHIGTLIAVAFYLRVEIITIIAALLRFGRSDPINATLGILLALATIPVVVAGYFVNYADWRWLDMVQTLAIANLGFAIILWLSDSVTVKKRQLESLTWLPALLIGVAQICALIPGASRSGVTISAARFLGYDRITAARLSLLLSLPTIAGAGLLKSIDLAKSGDAALGSDAAIIIALSAAFAWLAISWMMHWLVNASFGIFVYYRLVLGAFLLLGLSQGWLDPFIS
jgi:undecaprenyl-diphosphatase